MKHTRIVLIVMLLFIAAGCTTQLEMKTPNTLALQGITQHPYTAGLYVSKEFREAVYVNGFVIYPLAAHSEELFKKNLLTVFKEVKPVDSLKAGQDIPVIVQPSIVKFFANIPSPAYNPYIASIVYKVDVYDREGNKIFTQTATGDAQTSRGLLSGFVAQRLLSEAAEMAADKAIKQIIEGLASAEELKSVNP